MNVVGDVEGRHCLLVDDLIDTAGTLVKGAEALTGEGRGQRFGLRHARGALRSGGEPDRGIVVEGSGVYEFDPAVGRGAAVVPKIKSLSVAQLLAEAIRSIHEETSVSVLFV